MIKYIIRNCPAYSKDALDFCFAKNATQAICYNCTDCVLKRIVDECRNELDKRDAYSVSIHYDFARKILKFIEIEEVDDADKVKR